eukprot:RCo029914
MASDPPPSFPFRTLLFLWLAVLVFSAFFSRRQIREEEEEDNVLGGGATEGEEDGSLFSSVCCVLCSALQCLVRGGISVALPGCLPRRDIAKATVVVPIDFP